MKHKFLALCMAFVLSFVSVLPAHAIGGSFDLSNYYVDFATWALKAGWDLANKVTTEDDRFNVCPSNPNAPGGKGHHSFVEKYSTLDGKFGLYYVCEYCDTIIGDIFPDAYDSYTQQLPSTGYNSDKHLIWYPKVVSYTSLTYDFVLSSSAEDVKNMFGFYGNLRTDFSQNKIFFDYQLYNSLRFCNVIFYFDEVAPVSGYYTYHASDYNSNTYYGTSSKFESFKFLNMVTNRYYEKSSNVANTRLECNIGYYSSTKHIHIEFPSFYYEIIVPDVSSDGSLDYYSQDSRPTSFSNTGTLGVQTGDGNLSVLDNCNIVDETNNTYYNPVTQTDNSITSWMYDYSTRSYNVTLDNGQTVTVTYGDENITINEGDTVYNVYYVIQGTGPEPTPTPEHQHNYTSEDTKAPTCTMPGTRKFTCTECGDTYTKTIPATGHDWQVKTEVKTEYGEDGELLQEGYTIYQCSVCGEEYKATATTGPPPSGGGSSGDEDDDGGSGIGDALGDLFGVIGDLLTGLFGGAIELVSSLIVSLGDMLKQLLEFFSGFSAFLAAAFPFLPEPVMIAISSGIIIMIILAIIKFIRG